MKLIVNKTSKLEGKASIPGSKSQSIRGLLFALLAKGESVLLNGLDSEDAEAAKQICLGLGADIKASAGKLMIKSNGLPLRCMNAELYTGNSGISTLFSLPLLGLRDNCNSPVVLNCGEQMRARPVKPLVDALGPLGMKIQYLEQEGRLPISVQGKLQGGNAEVDGLNSQYLSALLISLPCAEKDSVVRVKDLHERPYVQMTLDFLNRQGVRYRHERSDTEDVFFIQGKQHYTAFTHSIPGDFSSASCPMVAAVLLPGQVTLEGLDFKDGQGDKRLVTILQEMGARIAIDEEKHMLQIEGNHPLKGIRIDANDVPDLVPALAILGTVASGKTEICNVSQARIKETDRIHSMTEGLRKMGIRVREQPDGMTIYPGPLKAAHVNGYGDHRTVMALTVAGMMAKGGGQTTISDGEAINKTYPQFIETMQALGARIQLDKAAPNKHVILIGFKHVGKSLIGHHLANKLDKSFIDLDYEIEKLYEEEYGEMRTCRHIMQEQGERFFRTLESKALARILPSEPSVISLGGGTLLSEPNQKLVQDQILLLVEAPHGVVFERIMVEGRPPFFDPNKDPYESFTFLWNERNKIFKQLTPCTVDNSNTIEEAVNQAIAHVYFQECEGACDELHSH